MTDPAARLHGTDAQAARPEAGGQRPAPGGLWLLLVPLACCGGPLLITSLAAAGALAWGGLGLALAAAAAGAALSGRRHRRACPRPQRPGQQAAADTGHSGAPAVMTVPAAGWHHEPGPDALVTARSRGSGTGPCPAFSRRGRIPVSIGQPPGAAG